MKLTEMIISAILKRGVFADLENVETNFDLPDTKTKLNIKIDNMTITIMKEDN
jgi:hypothetical protein